MKIATIIIILAVIIALSGSSVTERSKNPPAFGFVALRQLTVPTREAVESALATFLPPTSKISELTIDDQAVSFKVDDQEAMFGYLPIPIPWGDLEEPCGTSWLWPEAEEQLKDHQAHLIVMLLGDKGVHVDRCLLVTRLMAAASMAFDAIGMYWGHGPVVLSADQLQKMALCATHERLPLLVWINFYRERNWDESFSLLTSGLNYFGCMEIEILGSTSTVEDILDMALGIAQITIQGDVIKDGDTVGHDAETKIRVRHAKSKWKRKGKVLKVEM